MENTNRLRHLLGEPPVAENGLDAVSRKGHHKSNGTYYGSKRPVIHPLDVKLCNCAECGKELLGESMKSIQLRGQQLPVERWQQEYVYCRIDGRPLCYGCGHVRQSKDKGKGARR